MSERRARSSNQKVIKNRVFSEVLKNRFKNRLFLCVWKRRTFQQPKSDKKLFVFCIVCKTGSKTICFCMFERGARSSNQKPFVFLHFWKTGSKTVCFCVFERAPVWATSQPKIRREGEIPVVGYMGSQLGEREPSKLRLVGKNIQTKGNNKTTTKTSKTKSETQQNIFKNKQIKHKQKHTNKERKKTKQNTTTS